MSSVVEVEQSSLRGIVWGQKKCPKLLLCFGLPGCGKSTFAIHMEKFVEKVVRVNQDEMGKKDCYDIVSKNMSNDKLIIIDRCNATVKERKEFLDYLKADQKAWAICFTASEEDCAYRAGSRSDHPTVKSESACSIVSQVAKKMEKITPLENFDEIITIVSDDDLNYVLEKWKIPLLNLEPPVSDSSDSFIKFPRTKHLCNLGAATREDLIMNPNEQTQFFNREVYIQEKIDGSNIGISYDLNTYSFRFQNRGNHYIDLSKSNQFAELEAWRNSHSDELYELLGDGKHILFGEWLYVQKTILYTELPDYFIAYDIFDKEAGKFLAINQVDSMLSGTTIKQIRLIAKITPTRLDDITAFTKQKSIYYNGLVEGVFVRCCDESYTIHRAKIVRSEFVAVKNDSKKAHSKNLLKK